MRSSTTMSASQLMPNTMDRLKRFLPTKQEAAQDPFTRIQERAGFAQDVLRKSVTTIVQNLHRRQAEDEQEMMDLFLLEFAMHQGVDVEMLKAQLLAEEMKRNSAAASEDDSGGGIAKMIAGWLVKKVLFGLAKTAVVNFMRVLIKSVLRAGISFIFRTVLRYIAIGIAGAVGSAISALGLPVILGGLAIGGAGFVIYKKFFSDTPNEEASGPSREAQQPGSLWKNLLRRFLGWKEDTADIINSAVAANVSAVRSSQATVPITEEMRKKGLALLKYRTADIAAVIANASKMVGESEPILNAFAAVESRFDPNAGASTSSAKGLFQFVTGTWRYTVGKYGKRYGVSGDASVFDANANALMGAAYLKHEIRPAVERVVSNPSATDLYFGHLLGPGGGPRFLKGYYASPNDIATNHVADSQVKANKPVFYHKDGRAKTLAEVYMNFASKFTPIESYIKSPESFAQSSTLSVPAMPVGSLDTKTASYELPKVASKEDDLFNAMNKAQDKEAGSLATAPKDKDYVRGRKGKIVEVR